MTSQRSDRPVIAITMGDASGVGPEIIVKALAHAELYARCRPLVVGDARRLHRAADVSGLAPISVHAVEGVEDARFEPGAIDCIDLGLIPADLPFGALSAIAGDAAFQYVKKAVELAVAGKVGAICTAPLNKEALHAGGHFYPGHTEMLADLTHVPEVSMMLMAPNLRVIHVTTHIGLLHAIAKIEPGLVERTIARGHDTLKRRSSPTRASASAASIPMRARTACSATARRRPRSFRRWSGARPGAGGWRGPCRPTPCSSARPGATSTWWWPCITTRAMARSR